MNKQNNNSTQDKRKTRKTQAQNVLSYVDKHGSISTLQAMQELNVIRLASVVCRLKGTSDELVNITGKGQTIATYTRKAMMQCSSETSNKQDETMNVALMFYCDGAAPNNQTVCKRGGIGVVAYDPQGQEVYTHSAPVIEQDGTTSPRTELYALIHALEQSSGLDTICSDSEYCVEGFNEWLENWKSKGWRTSSKKSPKNLDLWLRVDELKAARPDVSVCHVNGHAGVKGNERADELASKAARG